MSGCLPPLIVGLLNGLLLFHPQVYKPRYAYHYQEYAYELGCGHVQDEAALGVPAEKFHAHTDNTVIKRIHENHISCFSFCIPEKQDNYDEIEKVQNRLIKLCRIML